MRDSGWYVHSPVYRLKYPSVSRFAGENIAMSCATSFEDIDTSTIAFNLFTELKYNPGHCQNILDKIYTHIGVGYADTGNVDYITQNFASYLNDKLEGYEASVTVNRVCDDLNEKNNTIDCLKGTTVMSN